MSRQTERLLQNSFGFEPENSTHHFLVNIPRGANDPVEMSEHFTWDAATGSSEVSLGSRSDGQIRARLARVKWDAIADEVRAQFNRRITGTSGSGSSTFWTTWHRWPAFPR